MNAFMHKEKGAILWKKAFQSATRFKKALLKDTTLFRPFLPPLVHGRKWEEEKTRTLMEDAAFFTPGPDETWHGFDGSAADL